MFKSGKYLTHLLKSRERGKKESTINGELETSWKKQETIIAINIKRFRGEELQYSCLEIPWMEEPGRLQSMGSRRVGHD